MQHHTLTNFEIQKYYQNELDPILDGEVGGRGYKKPLYQFTSFSPVTSANVGISI